MSNSELVQGLLFVVHKKKVEDMKIFQQRAWVDFVRGGHLLLPAAIRNSCPELVQTFAKHNIKMLTSTKEHHDLRAAVEARTVEVEEILVDCQARKGWFRDEKQFRIYTDEKNIRTLEGQMYRNFEVKPESSDSKRSFKWTTDADSCIVLDKCLVTDADVHLRHVDGGFFLHLASSRDDEPLTKLLLNKNAKVDAVMNDGRTALHIAADFGHPRIVSLLLQHGATVDAKDKTGATALHAAARRGHVKVCEMLLQHKANANAIISTASVLKGATPLHLAIDAGHPEIVDLLLKNGASMRGTGFFNKSCLQIAVEKGRTRIVDIVLNHGVDVTDSKSKAAFLAAVRSTAEEGKVIVEKMLSSGFELSVKDAQDLRLFHGAVRQSCIPMIEKLLELGVDVNASASGTRKTALHVAAEFSSDDVIGLLLRNAADVNVKCHVGKTPLFYAAQAGRLTAVDVLLKAGADITVQDRNSETVLSCVCGYDLPEMAEFLLKNGADVDERAPIFSAVKQGFLKVVKVLCRFGARVDVKGVLNRTVLHEAAKHGFCEIVSVLIQHGAEVNALDADGRTALFDAVRACNFDAVKVLSQFGARLDVVDTSGKTALHIAAEGRHEIFKYLLEYNFTDTDIFLNSDVCRAFEARPIEDKKSGVILLEHLFKVECLCFTDFKIQAKNIALAWCKHEPDFNFDKEECDCEGLCMKFFEVGTTEILYRDVILKGPRQVARWLRNESLVRELNSNKGKYPHYKEIIEHQISKGRQRKELVERGTPVISRNLFRDFGTLALELVEIILWYLSDTEIFVLTNICAGVKAE